MAIAVEGEKAGRDAGGGILHEEPKQHGAIEKLSSVSTLRGVTNTNNCRRRPEKNPAQEKAQVFLEITS